jgi:hypothetical protein
MRVLPQRTIDALGLQVEVRGQPAKWSGRVARETTPARKRRTTRPFVPCRRRHERSYRHALPSPGVCPPGVPLPSSGSSQGRIPGTFLGRKPAGLSARWGARPDPIAGPRSHPSPLPHSARDTASQRRLAGSRNGRRAVVRPRAIDSHLAPASVENSSRAAAIAFHATERSCIGSIHRLARCSLCLIAIASSSDRELTWRGRLPSPHCGFGASPVGLIWAPRGDGAVPSCDTGDRRAWSSTRRCEARCLAPGVGRSWLRLVDG